MMSTPWCRLYSETLDDLKLVRVANEAETEKVVVLGVWAGLLALANASPTRGTLLLSENLPLTTAEMATKIGIEQCQLDRIIEAFAAVNMVHWEDDTLILINFDKRNFRSDHSGPRVQKHRERQKEGGNDSEGGNDNVTTEDSYGNSDVTPSEQNRTDDRTEQNRTDNSAKVPNPTPKTSKRTKNPISEAVKIFRENAHRYPAKSWYADITEAVGDEQEDLDRWGNVVKAWVGLGWKPTNVRGMLDFFERNEIPPGKGRQRGKSSHRTPTETVEIASGLGPPS